MKDPLKDIPLRETERSRFDMFERYEPNWDAAAMIVVCVLLLLVAMVA